MSSSFKHKQRFHYSYRNNEFLRAFHCSQHKVSRVASDEEKSFSKNLFMV